MQETITHRPKVYAASQEVSTFELTFNITKDTQRRQIKKLSEMLAKSLWENGCFLHRNHVAINKDATVTTLYLRVLKPDRRLP